MHAVASDAVREYIETMQNEQRLEQELYERDMRLVGSRRQAAGNSGGEEFGEGSTSPEARCRHTWVWYIRREGPYRLEGYPYRTRYWYCTKCGEPGYPK